MKMTSKLRLCGAGALLGPAACAELLLIFMPVTLAPWQTSEAKETSVGTLMGGLPT
jgi:hypothetical protein